MFAHDSLFSINKYIYKKKKFYSNVASYKIMTHHNDVKRSRNEDLLKIPAIISPVGH